MHLGLARVRPAMLLPALLAIVTTGCVSLPSSGPTARQVMGGIQTTNGAAAFDIVDLDAAAADRLAEAKQHETSAQPGLASLRQPQTAYTVGPGDVLSITIYEIGVSLFTGAAAAPGGGYDATAHNERLPPLSVSDRGEITLPYIGTLKVEGRTTGDISAEIERRLRGASQAPQAVVMVQTNNSHQIYVTGDVRKPARIDLTSAGERLLDAVALAGGPAFPTDEMVVRVVRRGVTLDQRLSAVSSGSPDDLVLASGDRIELLRRPRSYTVLGAANRLAQVPFDAGSVSLAEAIARAGGISDAAADPTAIFMFRDRGPSERPVVYRLNLQDPISYFVAQRVYMQDKDVIYVANAAANQPTKLVNIVNQLFSPFIAVRNLAR